MVKIQRIIKAAALCFLAGNSPAADFSTPEAALREHQAAWAARDIERYLSTIDFVEPARKQATEAAKSDVEPNEAEIHKIAKARKEKYRQDLLKTGFVPDYIATCKIVTTTKKSPSEVRFTLRCIGPMNMQMLTGLDFVRGEDGWRVAMGG